jgi:hypothetical protein
MKRWSHPVAGPAGNSLPRFFVDLVSVFLDRKVFAAPRAAESYGPSADAEFDFLTADFADHILYLAWSIAQRA